MRYGLTLILLACLPLGLASTLAAQSVSGQQEELRKAKERASVAGQRSEELRQEAANAESAAARLLARRAVLAAEIEGANAQISAARARIAIINRRQQQQQALLGRQSAPLLRLNAALQQMTRRPVTFMLAQPGSRSDYVHLRAVMDAVRPEIERRTSALRQQIAIQRDLRSQEQLALKSLGTARKQLAGQRKSLAELEKTSRGKAGALSADAAREFELAIAQGERARDIVEEIDLVRSSGENAAALAELEGPQLKRKDGAVGKNNDSYQIAKNAILVSGFHELNQTGYRERGLRLSLPASSNVTAPSGGKVVFAGIYRSYGEIVIIEHGGGWTTLVTDLVDVAVDEGDLVAQGDVLGRTGEEDAEVTIELRRKGRVMDIAAMLM